MEIALYLNVFAVTPFGQLPTLEINGKVYSQTLSICRYLAKQFNLLGKTDLDTLQIDAIASALYDFRRRKYWFRNYANWSLPEWYALGDNVQSRYMIDTSFPFFLSSGDIVLLQGDWSGFESQEENRRNDESVSVLLEQAGGSGEEQWWLFAWQSGNRTFVSSFKKIRNWMIHIFRIFQLSYADLFFVAISDSLNTAYESDITEDKPHLKSLKEKVLAHENIKSWVEKRPKLEF